VIVGGVVSQTYGATRLPQDLDLALLARNTEHQPLRARPIRAADRARRRRRRRRPPLSRRIARRHHPLQKDRRSPEGPAGASGTPRDRAAPSTSRTTAWPPDLDCDLWPLLRHPSRAHAGRGRAGDCVRVKGRAGRPDGRFHRAWPRLLTIGLRRCAGAPRGEPAIPSPQRGSWAPPPADESFRPTMRPSVASSSRRKRG
jgi:hypothetical protein